MFPDPCIYYAMSLPIELSSHEQNYFLYIQCRLLLLFQTDGAGKCEFVQFVNFVPAISIVFLPHMVLDRQCYVNLFFLKGVLYHDF